MCRAVAFAIFNSDFQNCGRIIHEFARFVAHLPVFVRAADILIRERALIRPLDSWRFAPGLVFHIDILEMEMKMRLVLVICFALFQSSLSIGADQADAELQAMRAAANSYSAAWLSGDADAVMATFVDEPVLSPSGLPYLEGRQAARDFWFPADSPSTTVTRFEIEELEAARSGDLGYVRGTFVLAFNYAGMSYENRGKYVSLLGKQPDGSWLITHHLWDDFPRQE